MNKQRINYQVMNCPYSDCNHECDRAGTIYFDDKSLQCPFYPINYINNGRED